MRVYLSGVVVAGVLAAFGGVLLAKIKPDPVIAQAVGVKGDRLVMACIIDGPDGRICMGPMTRSEAQTYADAEPKIYRFGSRGYVEALQEVAIESALAQKPPAKGFHMSPESNVALVKRAGTFSTATLSFP